MPQESPSNHQRNNPPLERDGVSILSPLRYPGSKRRLASYIELALQTNDLHPSLFVEPFAGGASVALQLLNDDAVDRVILADLDPLVAAFWDVVFFDTEWLIDQIKTVEISVERWREFKMANPNDKRSQALACLFLNRTSFSGILAPTAGPIGGWGQKSAYTIECRFPRRTLIRRVQQAARLNDRVVDVWNLSWEATLERVQAERIHKPSWKSIFYYFDPPFFEKADKLYTHYFRTKDHVHFRDAILALQDPWILSYDAAEQIHSLYNGVTHGRATVELLYSTAASSGSQSVKEVILSNLKKPLPAETRLWRRNEEWKPARSGDINGNSHVLAPPTLEQASAQPDPIQSPTEVSP